MPPPNLERRAQLADAAIALLASAGAHGVTHRAVDQLAGLPAGTASNYFRSREALLIAAASRVGELHYADMETVADAPGTTAERAQRLIAQSLWLAATTYRPRYLAIFELRLESLRRPALAAALAELQERSVAATRLHHRVHELRIPPSAAETMVGLYGGALFTLVTAPPGAVTEAAADELATAIVRGSL
ncbi:TetR family transcriptional regulator [Actinoplanes sp. NPDC051633]|uniref:TetR/AcrR family transcriptional regulator n=1 Tax=Actinoplanes sp. NPDC051633 TaxID=3155670 RepID=UPI00341BCBD7